MKTEPEMAWVIEIDYDPKPWEDNFRHHQVVIGSREYANNICQSIAKKHPEALVFMSIVCVPVVRDPDIS